MFAVLVHRCVRTKQKKTPDVPAENVLGHEVCGPWSTRALAEQAAMLAMGTESCISAVVLDPAQLEQMENHEGRGNAQLRCEIQCFRTRNGLKPPPPPPAPLVPPKPVDVAGLRVFEVTLKGYDPDEDDTAHLVKWVRAPDRKSLDRYLEHHGLTVVVESIRDFTDPVTIKYTQEDGVDVVLNARGEWAYRSETAHPMAWKDQSADSREE